MKHSLRYTDRLRLIEYGSKSNLNVRVIRGRGFDVVARWSPVAGLSVEAHEDMSNRQRHWLAIECAAYVADRERELRGTK